MRCKAPFFHKDLKIFCPCGKCLACSISRRRKWTLRIYLESLLWRYQVFATLTYSNETIPKDFNLRPRDLTLFFKRLRKNLKGAKIRYFACGEYGSQTKRPHYHAIIFGLNAVDHTRLISDSWGLGHCVVKPAHKDNMEYVAGYCTKKYTGYYEDLKSGRIVREFTRSSRRPALGLGAIPYLIDKSRLQLDGQDVLRSLKIGSVEYPLDRLLRSRLREAVFTSEEIELIKEVYVEEMRREASDMMRARYGVGWRSMHPQALGEAATEHYYNTYHHIIEAQEKRFALRKKRSLI